MKRLKKGQVYEVVFLDHVEDSEEPMECAVWGRCRSCGPVHVVICSWDYLDTPPGKADVNQKVFSILQSTILSVRRLA